MRRRRGSRWKRRCTRTASARSSRSAREAGEFRFRFHVRLYEADFSLASDVAGMDSLAGADLRVATKRLLLELNEAGLGEIDNFSPHQRNQFIVLEVLPR